MGLYYSWEVSPVIYTDASPARFSEQYKSDYIELVSQAYLATGDWERSEQRLAALADPDINGRVLLLLDDAIRSQKPDKTIRGLAALAQQLGVEDRTVALFAPTPATAVPSPSATAEIVESSEATATPTVTPPVTATIPPSITPTPTATPQPNFRLLDQQQLCDQPSPQIEVTVLDALLDPQPGVEVLVRWDAGEDHFFTGFKPEKGLGYGDFTMSPQISYTVVLPAGSPEISGLRIETCAEGAAAGWSLTFQNLRLTLPDEG